MNRTTFNSLVQYVIIIGITVVLVWFALSNIHTEGNQSKWDYLLSIWQGVDKTLFVLSGLAAMVSHVIRAERWKLSFQPMNLHISLKDSFLSVMVGYFINLLIPRGGEISRCVNLNRLDSIPIDRSFGTVLAERAVDVVFLIFFVFLGFFLEFKQISTFLAGLQYQENKNYWFLLRYALLFILAIVVGIIFIRMLLKTGKPKFLRTYIKVKNVLNGIRDGLMVVLRLKRKLLFLFYSLLIWLLYFLMSLFVLKAFPETNHLGIIASMAIFAIGSIAMTLPLPGGTGSYHVLVPAGLVALYAIPLDKATAFTIIFHGWQTFLIIIFGAGSLFYSYYLNRLRKKQGNIMTK